MSLGRRMLVGVEVVLVSGLRGGLGKVGESDKVGEEGEDVMVRGGNNHRSRIIKDLGVGLGDR
jgi:hypothetical protein